MRMPISKEVYIRYYTQQYQGQLGGSLPVFKGGRHDQDGAGLGSILSGIFRRVAPIALHVARKAAPIAVRGLTSFAKNTLSAHQQGVPLDEAAKAALLPALGDAASAAFGVPQSGGKRRSPPRKRTAAVAIGGGADPSSPPKRRKRTAPKRRRQAGAGKGRKPAKRPRQAGGRKRRAPTKRTGQKGGRKRVYKKRGGGTKRKKSSGLLQF
jgi:hypothetical protein